MEKKRQVLLAAYRRGETLQSNNSGEWEDFEPNNQVDFPNLYHKSIDNWRIKPMRESVKDHILEEISPETIQKARDYGDSIVNATNGPLDAMVEEWDERVKNNDATISERKAFFQGLVWQKQRLYTEEELLKTLLWLKVDTINQHQAQITNVDVKEWFENYKKK